MVDPTEPTVDTGLSVWLVVAVVVAVVALIGAAVFLLYQNVIDPGSQAVVTTTTTTPVRTPITSIPPTTTTTTEPPPTTTTTTLPPAEFPKEPGTATGVLTSFTGTTEFEVTAGELTFSILSAGTFSDGRYRCDASLDLIDLAVDTSVIATPARMWVDQGDGFVEAVPFQPGVGPSVGMCPADPWFWADFDLPPSLEGGVAEEFNGVPTRRLDLDDLRDQAPDLGFLPTDDDDLELTETSLWLADPGGWVVGLSLSANVTPEGLNTFGLSPDATEGIPGSMSLVIRVSNPNDPSLTVELPPPNYPLFTSVEDLSLAGVALFVEDEFVLRVTPSINSSVAGAAWFTRKQPISGGFETTFAFRIHNIPQNTGDGFAFVIQNHSVTALGEGSYGIGYTDIPNSVAVEFDTVFQGYSGDPGPFHVGVHTRGTNANSSHESASRGRFIPTFPLADGAIHFVKVEYVPGTLTVYLDDLEAPVITVSLDLETTLRLDGGRAWVGFTASTEPGFRETHDILSWSFVPVTSE